MHANSGGISRSLPSWLPLPYNALTVPQLTTAEGSLLWNPPIFPLSNFQNQLQPSCCTPVSSLLVSNANSKSFSSSLLSNNLFAPADKTKNVLPKVPFVHQCDCVTHSSSCWILFNQNWQQLSSLWWASPPCISFNPPPFSGSTSRPKLSLQCYKPD